MILPLVTFALVPYLVVASTATTKEATKVKYYPKPAAWMLKPVPANDEHAKPPTHTTTSTYVNEYTIWVVQVSYSSTGYYCNEDEAIMKTALPANMCLQTGPDTSMMFQCYSGLYGSCTLYEYRDSYCYSYQTSNYVSTYYCHPGDATDDGYVTDDGNQYTSQQVILQQGFPVPLPGNSTTITYYDSSYCDPNTMSQYRLAYPDRCYNNYNGTIRTSTQYINPDLLSYSENGCDPATIDVKVPYPPGVCQVDYSTSPATSSMLVLNFPVIPVVPIDLGTILGTTAAAFSTMAIANTLLYFFQPYLSEATQSSGLQAGKPSEF
uniref:Uncharacterized protein n=1 Tax=Spumella elongata TaxID=89044 RepID=A0A7S3HSA8_9STRA|mmetsp:Transcript_6727/g.11333  ORF Transcript_6727/g.11333 Transcript_6727/m.11333 type:complete len:322 (+) Transcript_6727:18-983(+)